MIVLGLGSNVGDRLANLTRAVNVLSKNVLAALEMSPVYESDAVLKDGSPDHWGVPFLNMAVCGETHLSPSELLKTIKMIEKELGRQDRGIWAPREIDIDILAYNSLAVNNDELTIPHKHLYSRPFALIPLADIVPNWQCPLQGAFKGKTAYEITNQMFGNPCSLRKTPYTIELADVRVNV